MPKSDTALVYVKQAIWVYMYTATPFLPEALHVPVYAKLVINKTTISGWIYTPLHTLVE